MNISSFLLKQGSISSILTLFFLFLSLFYVKLQINIIGIEQYGLLVLLLSIFGTINMLNIGIGTAMVHYYTKYGEDKSVFWSIFIISFIFILLLSILVLGISSIFYHDIFQALKVEKQGLDINSFYGFSLIGISRLLSTITSSYWIAKVDFLRLKIFGFVNIYLSITFILIFYKLGFSLNKSLLYAGILNFIFISMLTLKIFISSGNFSVQEVFLNTKNHFKKFVLNGLQFQGLAVINNISNPIINVMINTHFGLEAVSLFDIALKLLRSGRQIIVSAAEPFFGKITQLYNKDKKKLIRFLVLRYTKYMMMIAGAYAIMTILFSRYILTTWVGEDITQNTYKIVYIVSIGFAINIITSIIYNKYLAIKKSRKYILYHQLILIILSIIPFLFNISNLEEYSIYYSVAFMISSIYLLGVFYKNSRSTN